MALFQQTQPWGGQWPLDLREQTLTFQALVCDCIRTHPRSLFRPIKEETIWLPVGASCGASDSFTSQTPQLYVTFPGIPTKCYLTKYACDLLRGYSSAETHHILFCRAFLKLWVGMAFCRLVALAGGVIASCRTPAIFVLQLNPADHCTLEILTLCSKILGHILIIAGIVTGFTKCVSNISTRQVYGPQPFNLIIASKASCHITGRCT